MLQKFDQKMFRGPSAPARWVCRDGILSYWLSSSSQYGFLRAGEPAWLPSGQLRPRCDCPSVPLDAIEHWGVSLQAPTVQTLSLRWMPVCACSQGGCRGFPVPAAGALWEEKGYIHFTSEKQDTHTHFSSPAIVRIRCPSFSPYPNPKHLPWPQPKPASSLSGWVKTLLFPRNVPTLLM